MMMENIAEHFWPASSAKGEPWVNRVLRKIQTPGLGTEFAIQASATKSKTKQQNPQQNNPQKNIFFFFPLGRAALL